MHLNIYFTVFDLDGGTTSDFSQGHITLVGEYATVTSKGREPNQSMMVFIACANLADTVAQFLDTKTRSCKWIGAGSFAVKFSKSRKGIAILCGEEKVGVVPPAQLLNSTKRAAEELIVFAKANLPLDSAVLPDLEGALGRLKRVQID